MCVYVYDVVHSERLSTVIHSLSEANKPSVHDMSGMRGIPRGLLIENNPSEKTALTGRHGVADSDSKHTNSIKFVCVFSKLCPICQGRLRITVQYIFTTVCNRRKQKQTAWGTRNSQHHDDFLTWWFSDLLFFQTIGNSQTHLPLLLIVSTRADALFYFYSSVEEASECPPSHPSSHIPGPQTENALVSKPCWLCVPICPACHTSDNPWIQHNWTRKQWRTFYGSLSALHPKPHRHKPPF